MTVVASNYHRIANDLYETPAWATRALLRHFPQFGQSIVWEPCAGNHAIVDALRAAGAPWVWTSDIATYGRRHDRILDLLDKVEPDFPFQAICSNPPYGAQNRTAAKCARRALALCPGFVALLLTAKFDCGSTRLDLFANNYRFAGKVVLLDRIKWFEGEYEGTEDHAWYVWGQEGFYRAPRLYYARNDEL